MKKSTARKPGRRIATPKTPALHKTKPVSRRAPADPPGKVDTAPGEFWELHYEELLREPVSPHRAPGWREVLAYTRGSR